MKLGAIIVEIRQNQKMTQEDFARIFHVTRQTISNWENEKSYPDIHTLIEISDRFGISLDRMLKEDTDMVNTISKDVAAGKKLKRGIFSASCVIVAAFAIYAAIWNYNKSLAEEKFKNGVEACGFTYDKMNGYYTREDGNIGYILPNQKMPGLFDFALDFHAKQLTAYIPVDEDTITLTMDERRETGINIISLSSSTYRANREKERIAEENKTQIEATEVEMKRIYESVYR